LLLLLLLLLKLISHFFDVIIIKSIFHYFCWNWLFIIIFYLFIYLFIYLFPMYTAFNFSPPFRSSGNIEVVTHFLFIKAELSLLFNLIECFSISALTCILLPRILLVLLFRVLLQFIIPPLKRDQQNLTHRVSY